MWLAPQQKAPVMLGEHDNNGIGTREMLAAAGRTAPRPAAADNLGRVPTDRAMPMAAMPVGEAQRAGEQGRLSCVELGQHVEGNARWR